MVNNFLRKYLKTALYPDGSEKVNKTLKMQMKKQDVIYPSRTCLGGEKKRWSEGTVILLYLSNI